MNNNIVKQYVHFDSIASKYIYDQNNTSGNTLIVINLSSH